MKVVAEYKLFLCPEKCEFEQKGIEYLGLVIFENKVKMNSVNVSRVCEWLFQSFKVMSKPSLVLSTSTITLSEIDLL